MKITMAQVQSMPYLTNGEKGGGTMLIENMDDQNSQQVLSSRHHMDRYTDINDGGRRGASNGLDNSSNDSNGFCIDENHANMVPADSDPAKGLEPSCSKNNHGDIIDVRTEKSPLSLAKMIRDGVCCGDSGQKSMPSLALWDGPGLELFEKVTKLPDYYLSWVETEILEQRSWEIAHKIASGFMIVDLGCGYVSCRRSRFTLQI